MWGVCLSIYTYTQSIKVTPQNTAATAAVARRARATTKRVARVSVALRLAKAQARSRDFNRRVASARGEEWEGKRGGKYEKGIEVG